DFTADGSAEVRVDGVLTFETAAGFYDYSSEGSFSLLLGGRSYGTTTNLYDSISVVQIPEPSTCVLLLAGLIGLSSYRRGRKAQ
ncbi:MAG: PEP-CTERM sorting domain-containing protein, partial [Myxococcota bacterium]